MSVTIITTEQFDELLRSLRRIEQVIEDQEERDGDLLLNTEEAAKYLGVSRRTLHDYKSRGLISCSQIGRKVIYRQSDIDAFLKEHLKRA